MADSSAVTLWDRRDGEDTLSIALLSDCQVAIRDVVGPGRLLHQAYSVVGRVVEKKLGQAAHEFGLGPDATSCRIEKAFGDDAPTRQSRLDTVYDFQTGTTTQHGGFVRALVKDCRKLLEYALPSQSPNTQIQAFKRITVLTMRYPGLRRMFLQSPDIIQVGASSDAIRTLWRSTEYIYDTKECFDLEFAAHCLARIDPNIELEGIRPSKLGCISEEDGLGVVDRLMVRYCDEGSGFPRLIAIRYLAGILGLPAFWLETYCVQKHTMNKLCRQTLRLIEDVNPDTINAKDIDRLASLDPDGVDALAGAILAGGRSWIQREPPIEGLGSDYWLPNFVKLIRNLRGLILADLLPIASQRAAENWETLLKDATDHLPMLEVDCHFEDVYTFVNGPSQSNWKPSHVAGESSNGGNGIFVDGPPRFRWRPSAVADESLNTDGGVPMNGQSYSRRSRISRFLPGHVGGSQSNWRPSDVADDILNIDAGSSSLLKAITAKLRATFSPTASNVEAAKPSDSPSGQDSGLENQLHPETPPDRENGRLAEEPEVQEDDPLPDQPSSAIEHMGDVTLTSDLGPAASNVLEQVTSPDSSIVDDLAREDNHLPGTLDAVEAEETTGHPAAVVNSVDGTGEGDVPRLVDAPVDISDDEDTSHVRPLDGDGVNSLSHEAVSGLVEDATSPEPLNNSGVNHRIKPQRKRNRPRVFRGEATTRWINSESGYMANREHSMEYRVPRPKTHQLRDGFRGDITGFIDVARNAGDVTAYTEPYIGYTEDSFEYQIPRRKKDRSDTESYDIDESDSLDSDGSGSPMIYGRISGVVNEAGGTGNVKRPRENLVNDSRGSLRRLHPQRASKIMEGTHVQDNRRHYSSQTFAMRNEETVFDDYGYIGAPSAHRVIARGRRKELGRLILTGEESSSRRFPIDGGVEAELLQQVTHKGVKRVRVPFVDHKSQEKRTSVYSSSPPIDATPVLESRNHRTYHPQKQWGFQDSFPDLYSETLQSLSISGGAYVQDTHRHYSPFITRNEKAVFNDRVFRHIREAKNAQAPISSKRQETNAPHQNEGLDPVPLALKSFKQIPKQIPAMNHNKHPSRRGLQNSLNNSRGGNPVRQRHSQDPLEAALTRELQDASPEMRRFVTSLAWQSSPLMDDESLGSSEFKGNIF